MLLCGEVGLGKEALARAIHLKSLRKEQPFVSVCCNSLAEAQIWSVLFGAKEASNQPISLSGKVAGALGGTLFLDELHTLPTAVQIHLMKVIKLSAERSPLRENRGKKGIRLLAGSGLELSELRKSGILIRDLMDHLSGELVTLSPLRESKEDIAALARHFTERFALHENPNVHEITDQAVQLLQSYDWPGNVLELERVIFRAVILSEDSVIDVEHILPYMPPSFVPEFSVNGM